MPNIDDATTVEKLSELLDYVGQVIKLDERPTFALSECRVPNGQTFIFHQHELHALDGFKHDLADDDGPIWLSAERLKRIDPPIPEKAISPWIEVSADPDKPSVARSHILMTVTEKERDELIASGSARAEDCAPTFDTKNIGRFDVRLRLEDRPQLATDIEDWISSVWVPWSISEKPRRRSIAMYQKLFQIAQLSEIGAAEQPIELVWGVGVARWICDGTTIDLPLVERLVEIEIDENAAGTIRVRPRQAPATVNLRPYDELKVDGVITAQDAARRILEKIDGEDLGLSPFDTDTIENVLRSCQTRLDPEGIYLPDVEHLEPTAAPPSPTTTLVVTDRWVLFARRRSDNFLLRDIANLKNAIESSPSEIPGPSRTLVTGPASTSKRGRTSLPGSLGGIAAEPMEDKPAGPLGDLFFPKPFNNEQVEIVRRLETNDGVVVQGPPGTGKTHTISNIICHYLAIGRRVLVVSHGEAALAVLRNHLPEEVRDLAISITTSEKEGFKQLEGAVRLLQSIAQGIQAIAMLHSDIRRADSLEEEAARDGSVIFRLNSVQAVQDADDAASSLNTLIETIRHHDRFPFLATMQRSTFIVDDAQAMEALRSFLFEANEIISENAKYLQRPVSIPDDVSADVEAIVARCAAGDKVFGVFAFKEKSHRPVVDSIRILSRAPSSPEEWSHVRDYIIWRRRFAEARLRWTSLAPELGAGSVLLQNTRQLSELREALESELVRAPAIRKRVQTLLGRILISAVPNMLDEPGSLNSLRNALRNRIAAIRLNSSREPSRSIAWPAAVRSWPAAIIASEAA